MNATSILFKHEIGLKESPKVVKRRQILMQSVAEIERSYNKISANKKIASLGKSRKEWEEALNFYNAVVTDGRYVELLAKDPQAASDKLGLHIRKEVIVLVEEIVRGVYDPGRVQGPVEAVIAVAVVIAVAAAGRERPEELIVLDSSANVSLKL